ncbi:MAG: hydroxysqualene dehydroxylase HpnE [Acidimicrobiales bacterium]
MSPERVVVVGGGLAGMAAALEAADRGAEVVLVERRAHLGGLTWSFERHGLSFDNGQHVFLRCCTAYLDFLRRLGGDGQVNLQRRLDVPVLSPDGTRSRIARSGLPAPLHLARSLLGYRHLSPADRLRLGRAVLGLRALRLDDPALDRQTFGSWLARHGQRPVAVERLWDLVTLPTVNVPAGEASLALAAKVFRTGLLDSTDGGDLGWSAVPLSVLHGENGARALDRAGVEVVLGAAVSSVEPAVSSVEPAGGLRVTAGDRVLRADAVVAAVPPTVASAVLPPGALADVTGLGTSPIVNVHLVFDRRVTDLPLAAAVGSPVQFVFDHTAASGMAPRRGGQCLVVSQSAADGLVGRRPEELVRTFHQALGALLPQVGTARLVDGVVTRERSATFRGIPGTAALRPGAPTPVPGVFLAGAWCDTGWPATMEGAVRSGTAAARAALTSLGAAPTSLGAVRHHPTGSRAPTGPARNPARDPARLPPSTPELEEAPA